MTRPSRPAAGRPAARRASVARSRPARPRTAPSSPTRAAPARGPLTTRAAILGLVVCTLAVSGVLPLRTFLDQRAEIAEMEADQAAARERVADLEAQKQQLQDPAFLAAEARRRLNMARPGEVTYVLITPAPAPPAEQADAPPAGPEAPWWTQTWSSVAGADGAGP